MREKINLLIIDDEEDFLDTIAKRLEMRGFDVTTASDGYKALRAVKSKKYDIALLDLKMPGLDGFEVLRELKREHKYIEVIILTAHGSVEARLWTAQSWAPTVFLQNPNRFEELINSIKDAYETRLRKKFENDDDMLQKVYAQLAGIPLESESALDMLKELRKLDNDEK